MTVQIPREYTALFKDFFTDFDNDLESLEIQTYGVSITTLEQVFLEIGHNPNPKPRCIASTESAEQGPSASNDGLDSNGNANWDSPDKNQKVKISAANKGTTDKVTVEKGESERKLIQEEQLFPDLVSPSKVNGID